MYRAGELLSELNFTSVSGVVVDCPSPQNPGILNREGVNFSIQQSFISTPNVSHWDTYTSFSWEGQFADVGGKVFNIAPEVPKCWKNSTVGKPGTIRNAADEPALWVNGDLHHSIILAVLGPPDSHIDRRNQQTSIKVGRTSGSISPVQIKAQLEHYRCLKRTAPRAAYLDREGVVSPGAATNGTRLASFAGYWAGNAWLDEMNELEEDVDAEIRKNGQKPFPVQRPLASLLQLPELLLVELELLVQRQLVCEVLEAVMIGVAFEATSRGIVKEDWLPFTDLSPASGFPIAVAAFGFTRGHAGSAQGKVDEGSEQRSEQRRTK
ncbi:hypothetical protein C8R46DRAFT_1034128 [Mycena filopes]|nr:hypothetical protein C8R46DRAFT_1034128 [Mycena filopes]